MRTLANTREPNQCWDCQSLIVEEPEFGDVLISMNQHKVLLFNIEEEECCDNEGEVHQVATMSATYLTIHEATKLRNDLDKVIRELQRLPS